MRAGSTGETEPAGLGPRQSSSALEAPGEVPNMKVGGESNTWVVLRWKSPVEGGEAGFYKIQRRSDGGPWKEAGTSTNTKQLMSDQPRGIEIDFRVRDRRTR